MNCTRTFDVMRLQAHKYPNPKALRGWSEGKWESLRTEACLQRMDDYSQALLSLGLKKGDLLLTVPELATLEWVLLDLAAQQIGLVVVPIHATHHQEQFDHILQETQARVIFFAHPEGQARFSLKALPDIGVFYTETPEAHPRSLRHLVRHAHQDEELSRLRQAVLPEDLACIIYTSGTTGVPKGVMLSHDNIISNVKAVLPLLPLHHTKRSLSFLPYSHIFERTTLLAYIASGTSLALVGDRERFLEAFQDIRPHYFTTVPRILEKMYDQVLTHQAQQNWWKKRIIGWALKVGHAYKENAKVRPWYAWQRFFARWLVFQRFHQVSGGKVEAILTGAAYLQPEISRIFAVAGIKVREGYGMTETSPVISINRFTPGLVRFGTVGVPVPGVEVKIDEADEQGEGEIIVRGPNVMQGYFKKPEETAKVLQDDGWFKTGDVGKFVKGRFLQITDRRKDIFKTSAGKYIAPLVLENHFRQSSFIDQIMVVGFKRPYLTALVRPNYDLLKVWCESNGIHWTSPQYMAVNLKVRQKLLEEVEKLNQYLPNFQRIKEIHLFHQEWTPEDGYLSYTMKLLRSRIATEYGRVIEKMYEG
ncbi:MAG: long-chain fatty acid--CoA ligase [Bacteroidota bacterium]